jgi:CRISPR-associated protein Cas5h
MRVVRFRYHGKFGHFLRAEANVDGLTYPVPTPTVLLGLAGAVLGLGKDEPQQALEGARFAVGGKQPRRFWHTTNIRKDPPAPLSFRVRRSDRGTSKEQRNMRFAQEWLWRPDYLVWASLPEQYHADLVARLREGRWHFLPCLGLANLLAHLEFGEECEGERLSAGVHPVETVAPRDAGEIDLAAASRAGLTLQSLRMPSGVGPGRAFTHRAYWLELEGHPYPLNTDQAYRCGQNVVVWL